MSDHADDRDADAREGRPWSAAHSICLACGGSGKGARMWTSSGTSLEPPAWVAAMPYPACPACGGADVESHPLPLYVHPAPNELEQAVHALTFDMETVKRETALAFDVLADVERLAAAAMEPCRPEPCVHCEKLACAIDEHEDWCLVKHGSKCKPCRLLAALRMVCAIMEEMS